MACGLFCRAFLVQFDQTQKDLFVGQFHGPAVGGGDFGVDLVMNVAQDTDQALIVNLLVVTLDMGMLSLRVSTRKVFYYFLTFGISFIWVGKPLQ